MAISGVTPEGVAIPELGVAPLVDSETDLEDELPTPDDCPFMSDSSPEGVCLPGVRPTPPDVIDLELEKALLNVSILPVMVTPIVDPVVGFAGGSVFVSEASSSCTAERRPRPYFADFSTPGGGRQSDPGSLSIVPHVARLLRI